MTGVWVADVGVGGGSGILTGGSWLSVVGGIGDAGGFGATCSGIVSGVAVLAIHRMSMSMVHLGSCFWTGIKRRRNFLFRQIRQS